jgi:hypothetical protein
VRLINRIEAHGCVVKDIDLGLLDFPSMRDGRPIYLCWKAGEPSSPTGTGPTKAFADRKPLESANRRRSLDKLGIDNLKLAMTAALRRRS